MIDAYIQYWQRYVDFRGRSSRSDYWYVILMELLIGLLLYLPIIAVTLYYQDDLISTALIDGEVNSTVVIASTVMYALMGIYGLATMVPRLALVVRRLHDVGKDWFWIFISYVPLIGGIWFLILMIKMGEGYTNDWGPNPMEYEYEAGRPQQTAKGYSDDGDYSEFEMF